MVNENPLINHGLLCRDVLDHLGSWLGPSLGSCSLPCTIAGCSPLFFWQVVGLWQAFWPLPLICHFPVPVLSALVHNVQKLEHEQLEKLHAVSRRAMPEEAEKTQGSS